MNTELSNQDSAEIEEIEQTIFRFDECFVYKVGPKHFNLSYRALEWNLENPFAICSITVSTTATKCFIRLYKTGESTDLLIECPIDVDMEDELKSKLDYFVDTVADSSRYFVLRIHNEELKKTMFLGVGFRERETAFNFKAAIDDYYKGMKRAHEPQLVAHKEIASLLNNDANETAEEDPSEESNPQLDFSVKSGEKLTLDLKTLHIPKKHRDITPVTQFKDGKLAPPPGLVAPSSRSRHVRRQKPADSAQKD